MTHLEFQQGKATHVYDHLTGKTIYVPEAQRQQQAEIARLLHEARLARPGWLSRQAHFLAYWMASWLGRLEASLDRRLGRDVVPSAFWRLIR